MQRLILLHSNDIHGRVEGLARLATLIDQIRAENPAEHVLYVDLGDIEETSNRLSNLTKGVAMYRLMSLTGCAAGAIGNGGIMRYGPQVLPEYAQAANYPLLLANLRERDGNLPAGIQPTALLRIGELHIGMIGLTAPMNNAYALFGLKSLPAGETVRECAGALRQDGADVVFVLSHLGLNDDRLLTDEVQADVQIILGAHSHDLLPSGEQHGEVLVAQAGNYAEHLGRIDMTWDGDQLRIERVTVLPVSADLPPNRRILEMAAQIERESEQFLAEIIGELAEPLDFAADRECGVANLLADALRERMQADVAVVSAGQAFRGPLPAGRLPRIALWDACESSANPGVVAMSGAQLEALVRRGLDPAFAAERPRQLRGAARGMFHLSGATVRGGALYVGGEPIEPDREYMVAGSDWELEPYGGYMPAEWGLQPQYEVPTIMREALEEYLHGRGPVHVAMARVV